MFGHCQQNRRRPKGLTFDLPTRTQQHMKDECDINKIMARYQKTGLIEHLTDKVPTYGDMPESIDYLEAMQTVAEAKTAFEHLPSTVREKFSNNPEEWLEFIHDAESVDEAIEALGLVPDAIRNPPEAAPTEPSSGDPVPTPPENQETPENGSEAV